MRTPSTLSAVAAGLHGLARGAGRRFGRGAVRQTIIEMEAGFIFVTAGGNGACIAVLATEDADVGLIAYEMEMLVARVGQFSTPVRADHERPGVVRSDDRTESSRTIWLRRGGRASRPPLRDDLGPDQTPSGEFDLITLIMATRTTAQLDASLQPELSAIVGCARIRSPWPN